MTGQDGRLTTAANLDDPDGFYAAFIAAHSGLSDAASEMLNARLVLILANQVGDRDVLLKALALARSSLAGDEQASPLHPDPP